MRKFIVLSIVLLVLVGFAITSSAQVAVDIDIKPGSDPNSINLKSKGVIPVAILGSAIFDVTYVDVTTLVFAGASPAHDLNDPLVYCKWQVEMHLVRKTILHLLKRKKWLNPPLLF